MNSQALRLHETTINRYISDYLNNQKTSPVNGAAQCYLSEPQPAKLISLPVGESPAHEKGYHYTCQKMV